MNKKILIICLAIIAVIVLAVVYLFVKNPDKLEEAKYDNTSTQSNNSTPQDKSPDQTEKSGQYTDYSETAVNQADGTKLLFFHASWCPQCIQLDSSIKNSQIPSGVTIFKVDYDSNQKLRQKYGVTLQTTVVKIDSNGNLINKYVAYDSPSLESIKKNLL